MVCNSQNSNYVEFNVDNESMIWIIFEVYHGYNW